ncbi:MAG: HD-GYP domain-containing protein, partial [Planctomycetaceae bacterium]|nr:HD-GYP domain-containing protein [Planctomycetaceae bacterium]
QASLANSIAAILGTHSRNIDLYRQHDALLLSFVRSLVSTLDAKDAYTRGHSERVALIGRRLGEELNLPPQELYQLYLAGLLHDIGKIGVDDRILQKPGQLTEEEFHRIQQHPLIGYQILQGLTNLQAVLPGVRNHHEAWSGNGYPDRLKGEEIPLMARILAVADSYDAMGSDRPYRKGMPVNQIEQLFRRGAGNQWDAAVIDAYFACAADIALICTSYSLTDGNLLSRSLRMS